MHNFVNYFQKFGEHGFSLIKNLFVLFEQTQLRWMMTGESVGEF